MTLSPGNEFNASATPSQALLRRLAYLAAQGNGSVMTRGVRPGTDEDSRNGDRRSEESLARELFRQQQTRLIHDRLDALDRASAEALRKANERMEEIRRNANRAKDGRLVFMDEDDGRIYDEQDREVSYEDVDHEKWNPRGTTRREFQEQGRKVDEAREYRRRVHEQRGRLDNDPSDDDLANLERDIRGLETSMPSGVATEYRPPRASLETQPGAGVPPAPGPT